MTMTRSASITSNSLSYRQLDYWTRKGYIRPRTKIVVVDGVPTFPKGSGHPRDYSDEEIGVAVRMARLVDRGMTPAAAAKIARHTPGAVYLGQGVTVVLADQVNGAKP